MKRTVQLRIHLTSFGPFLDVVDNPSHTIGNLIERHFREAQVDETSLVVLAEHVNLEVSIDAVAEYFATHKATSTEQSRGEDQARHVIDLFVHLGVHRGAKGEVRVETCARNDIHCPQGDFKGVRLDHQPIFVRCPEGVRRLPPDEVEFSVDSVSHHSEPNVETERDVVLLRTNVPRDALRKAVETVRAQCSREYPTGVLEDGRFAANVIFSDDAGRYLCNYCYCRSLVCCAERNDGTCRGGDSPRNEGKWMSVFLHVLDPDRNDFGCKNPTCDAQAACIVNLLQQLAESLSF